MNFLKLKPIGLRNFKTAIAVFLCLSLIPGSPLFAAIASVICMQDTVEHSLDIGKVRLIGTFIGGVLGILILPLTQYFNLTTYIPLITAMGVSFSIYICNLIKKPSACAISCLVLISIMISPTATSPISYSINRIFETAFGIIIAILVNKYFNYDTLIKINPLKIFNKKL